MPDTTLVKAGDTLLSIARRVYGDSALSPILSAANPAATLAPGETLITPALPSDLIEGAVPLSDTVEADSLQIAVDGIVIQPQSARVVRTMDTGADGWTALIPWVLGEDPELDAVTKPYSYRPATVRIGGEKVVSGLLYKVAPRLTDTGSALELAGWSYTADAVDSTMPPPYERSAVTLSQLAAELFKGFGLAPVFETTDTDGQFDRATAQESDTVFGFLSKLAAQRGLLMSSTVDGEPLFLRAETGGNPVGSIVEGDASVSGWGAEYDGRKRFHDYRAIGQSPGDNAKATTAIDQLVPRSRSLAFTAHETTNGNIRTAAEWKRTRTLAGALSIPLTIAGWIGPDGQRWRENTIVTVVSKTLRVPDGFDFLIRAVEYNHSTSGKSTTLSLVPPQVYTGEQIPEVWV